MENSDTHLDVPGVSLATVAAGIRKPGRLDVLLMVFAPDTAVAGVFTQNRFCAAPVQVCRAHLELGGIRALFVNTGCANAGTGDQGLQDARQTCRTVADALALQPHQVLPFSTGVILEWLPMDRLLVAVGPAVTGLGSASWGQAAEAIMTTDTVPKQAQRRVTWSGGAFTVAGIAKGAGMIRPNMATMLGFVATDAAVSEPLLRQMTREIADRSFNRITVDGDTSTNDSFIIAATGQAAGPRIEVASGEAYQRLFDALLSVAQALAQAIIRDGEGATKFITVQVEGGRDEPECLQIAYAISHSPLVKTAFFACDPNLGRILAAVGYAGVKDLDVAGLRLYLDEVLVSEHGGRAPDYTESQGQAVMRRPEITIRIELGRGDARAQVWTCDLSQEYVRINADYRS